MISVPRFYIIDPFQADTTDYPYAIAIFLTALTPMISPPARPQLPTLAEIE